MKKIFAILAVFTALIFAVSCGGGSNGGNNQNDYPDSGDTVTDDDADSGDSGSADNDPSDSGHEDPDTAPEQPDNGDSQPDGGDTAPDNDSDSGDTTPDNGDSADDTDTSDLTDDADSSDSQSDDDADSDSDPLYGFPICSHDSVTPCIFDNNIFGLVWSAKSSEQMHWSDAIEYCQNLTEGGYDDWKLPSINLLYAGLLQNCEYPKYINDACLGGNKPDGEYSPFGDIGFLWSSTPNGTSEAWGVYFYNGAAQNKNVDERFNVRCVRIATTSVNAECIEIPENAVHNTASEITLTWSWETWWAPGNKAIYDEDPSTEECRFKCEDNYYWWGPEKGCIEKRPTWDNICTGQDKCYNEPDYNPINYTVRPTEIITCPNSSSSSYFGQDAYFASIGYCAPQSFISSSDVVTDRYTGLTWEKSPSTDTYTWDDRATHCNELNNSNYGGKSNWRVPNPFELLTIVDNSKYNPATNSKFTDMPTGSSDYLWTNKEYNTSSARVFRPYSGSLSYSEKTVASKVLCVSGSELVPATSSNFVTSSDGLTVTDTRTALIWQKEYVTGKTWQQALKYCEDLSYAGYTDWRLPNKNELASLLNHDKSTAPYSDFPDMPSSDFWSSTTSALDYDDAWHVGFGYGSVGTNGKNTYNGDKINVRCVRARSDSESKCFNAGGIYDNFAEDELTKCYKKVECTPKPANTRWWGEHSYKEYYDLDSGTWTNYGESLSTEYSNTGEQKACQFICAAGYNWNGDACTKNSYPNLGNICTGQTSCYNTSSSMTCPSSSSASFFGQDAYYATLGLCFPQSFTTSSNVIVDNNTGLTWEKSPSEENYTWDNRNTHCSELNSSNYGGRSNWRVPNPLELLTIVNNSTYNPATNSNFTNMPTNNSTYLWTNNEYKGNGNTIYAYYFSPSYGWYWYDGTKTNTYKVLCVSGEEMKPAVSSDFTTSSDGKTVTDNRTGLIWQKEYVTGKTWAGALAYCRSLNTEDQPYAGYTDWHLPNKNELASLLNHDKSTAPYSDFPDMPSSDFWSSSTYVDDTNGAWYVDFNYGYVINFNKMHSNYVRCVR